MADTQDGGKSGIEVPLGGTSVIVKDVSVSYRVSSVNKTSRKAKLLASLGLKPKVTVQALSGVSFSTRAGEAVGILGLNGSGKSTLLRVIGGLESPDTGSVLATSQPTLLGVSAALEPSLSGVDNIRLGCLAMGLTPDQTEGAMTEVIKFVDIGDSIYLPMETYSSGMSSRLRFAISTAARPEIMLIDEALSTGDASFKRRSELKMATMRENAGTMFLVSHAAQTIEEMCTRAIWLHKGVMLADEDAYSLAREYRQWAWHIAQGKQDLADGMLKERLSQLDDHSRELIARAEGRPTD